MKQVLLTIMMAGTVAAYAVPLHTKKAYTHEEQRLAHEMAWQQQYARMTAKGTANMRRLAATTYTANGVLIDTNAHRYSGGRGSTHTTMPDSYYDTYSMTDIQSLKAIFCDTSIGWYDNGGLLWDGTTVYTYDAANNTTKSYSSSPYLIIQYEGVYNGSNQLVQVIISDTFGGTALIPKTNIYIKYDGSGKRVMDSSVTIATGNYSGKRVYSYDANGYMTMYESYGRIGGSGVQLFFRGLYTYDGNGRVLTETTAYDFGNGMNNDVFDSFAYAGNALHPVHHRTALWVDSLSAWNDYEILDYTLNAQGQPESYIIYRHLNQWDTVERDVYQYDTYGLLVKSNGYLYIGNGQYSNTPYDQSVLYYEEYDPNTVQGIEQPGRVFALWPNPAAGRVYYEAAPGYTTIEVTNTTGQVVLAEEGISAGSNSVNTAELPAGNYIMTLRNTTDNTVMTAKFVKQ